MPNSTYSKCCLSPFKLVKLSNSQLRVPVKCCLTGSQVSSQGNQGVKIPLNILWFVVVLWFCVLDLNKGVAYVLDRASQQVNVQVFC